MVKKETYLAPAASNMSAHLVQVSLVFNHHNQMGSPTIKY